MAVILRELREGDADAVRCIYGARAAASLRMPEMTAPQAVAYIAAACATAAVDPRAEYRLGIDVDQDLVGLITVKFNGKEGHLSYVVREDCWGRGLCTSAVELLVNVLPTVDLTAKHPHENRASARVLSKAGFGVVAEDERFCHHARRAAARP